MDRNEIERAKIIQEVENLALTPQQGEEIARRKGLSPLVQNPDPASFDCFSEQFWSLPMLYVWIMYRSPTRVAEYCRRFSETCVFWDEKTNKYGALIGRALKQRSTPSLFKLANDEQRQGQKPQKFMELNEAQQQLAKVVSSGELEVVANFLQRREDNKFVSSAPTTLQTYELTHLDFMSSDSVKIAALKPQSLKEGFINIRFETRQVLAMWPAYRPGKSGLPSKRVPVSDAISAIARNGNELSTSRIFSIGLLEPAKDILLDMISADEATLYCECNDTGETKSISQSEARKILENNNLKLGSSNFRIEFKVASSPTFEDKLSDRLTAPKDTDSSANIPNEPELISDGLGIQKRVARKKPGPKGRRDWSEDQEWVRSELREHGDPREEQCTKYESLERLFDAVERRIEASDNIKNGNDLRSAIKSQVRRILEIEYPKPK